MLEVSYDILGQGPLSWKRATNLLGQHPYAREEPKNFAGAAAPRLEMSYILLGLHPLCVRRATQYWGSAPYARMIYKFNWGSAPTG